MDAKESLAHINDIKASLEQPDVVTVTIIKLDRKAALVCFSVGFILGALALDILAHCIHVH